MAARDDTEHGEPGILAERRRTDDFAATMNGWFWETDASFRFIYMSPNVERITGLTPEWHYGKRRIDLGCPESISAEEWENHLETLEKRRSFSDFVFRRKGPTGNIWLCTSGNPVFGAQGEFLGYRGTATDVTSEVEARDRAIVLASAIEDKNRILETTLRTIPDGVHVVNEYLKLVAWNDQLFDVMDLDKAAILATEDPGKAILRTLAERGEYGDGQVDDLIASREDIVRAGQPMHYERQLATGKWIECRAAAVPGGSYMAVYRDVTATRQMIHQLEMQASVDPLTGVLNRRKFMEIAEAEFSRAQRYSRPLCLVVMDIDHFKSINDTHGHAAGDAALCQMVGICENGLRETDRVGRFGGEEFVLMLPETGLEGAVTVAERLGAAIAATPFPGDVTDFRVTVSAGVAQVTPSQLGVEEVISAADTALYEAKRAGRNCVRCQIDDPGEDLAAGFAGA